MKTAQPKAGETVTTFKSNSYLVIVDVEATDKSGNPIQNLRKEDFTVTEDGKKQEISIFQYQELTQEPEAPEELKLSDEMKLLPEAPKTELTSPTPGQLHYKDKRLMVFYMDFSSMQIPEQLRAQDAALDYLKKFITKDDLVAIVLYTTTPNIMCDFTDDRDTLTNVIRQLPIGQATDLAGLADTGDTNGADTGAAFVADESEFNVYNTDQKLYAIGQIAKMLKSFPEKKALLYFSSGVSATGVENEAQLASSREFGGEGQHGYLPDRCPRPDGRSSGRRCKYSGLARFRRLQRRSLQLPALRYQCLAGYFELARRRYRRQDVCRQ